MAQGLSDFAGYLKSAKKGEFAPRPIYEPETDSILYYRRDARNYEHRVNGYLTLFLAVEDDTVVGMEIKGVRATLIPAIEDMDYVALSKPVTVKSEDGEDIDISVMLRCALVPPPEQPIEYEKLQEFVSGVTLPRRDLCGS
jgi:hypothetical protein